MIKNFIFSSLLLISNYHAISQINDIFPGADEKTPSRSEYFSWINNTNEGATEEQTLINLDFFKWLHKEYGMQLDIYAFDAGAIDGRLFYGTMNSIRFENQFPNGFKPIYEKASSMGTHLGIWGGPDGFGETEEEAQARIEMMVKLTQDFDFELFKMDAVCGQLRPEKYHFFDSMMTKCRFHNPNLILLNHRLDLGPGTKHSTTFLLGGAETYIDVHMANKVTAPHHRAGALSRESPPNLTRLTEDHGVCLSSCLDYWQDDLILQAFNRNLILAPQIYGNPWLLKDEEFPQLARIFNLHHDYREILVDGILLPEKEYGPNAVSRGDAGTRFITLRNLSWQPTFYNLSINESIGLNTDEKVIVQQYHPVEKFLGEYAFGSNIKIEVLPFRSALIKVQKASAVNTVIIKGSDYQVLKEKEGEPIEIKLMGFPGEEKQIELMGRYLNFSQATLEGKVRNELLENKKVKISFPGKALKQPYIRKIADLPKSKVPDDVYSLYESTSFAADNNALEVRSLQRSGDTKIPEVQRARDAFFNQRAFINRHLWDKYLFDNNDETSFGVNLRWGFNNISNNALRIDIGHMIKLDSLIIEVPDIFSLQPLKVEEGNFCYVSNDLKNWHEITFLAGKKMVLNFSIADSIRYIRIKSCPIRISEVYGYYRGEVVDRSNWRASNLFRNYDDDHWRKEMRFMVKNTWSHRFKVDEIPDNSYLCIAINGVHGEEEAFAAVKVNGKYFGCPDRSPSFQSNTWEAGVKKVDKNYTYYFPLRGISSDDEIEVFVLGFDEENNDLKPEVYINSYPTPYQEKTLIIK